MVCLGVMKKKGKSEESPKRWILLKIAETDPKNWQSQ
jgi:hypothetical protein